MKSFLPMAAALLLQAGTFPSISSAPAPLADPQHLRYVRTLTLPPNASGVACTVLDGSVYAHAASSSADDLRVFQTYGRARPQEIPFVVSYSEAQAIDTQTAAVRNLTAGNGAISFDLDMPPRPYSEVDLQLSAHDFFATADVTSSPATKPLGVFTLFDLSAHHLPSSTRLALQETTAPHLHVLLHLRNLEGVPIQHSDPSIVQGATVPASREAQTLYTVVASSSAIQRHGNTTTAQLEIPSHLPVERVQFVLNPAFKSDFLRNVSIVAAPNTRQPGQPQEVIQGQISRVTRPPNAAIGAPAINAAHLSIPAVIASSLRDPATIRISVDDAGQAPLPITAVQLQMRQRTLCFNAIPNATYTLRYGDNDLRASVYDLGELATLPPKTLTATLGLEELNPGYLPRSADTTYDQRNPNLFWIALLAAIAVLGSFVSRRAMRQGRSR